MTPQQSSFGHCAVCSKHKGGPVPLRTETCARRGKWRGQPRAKRNRRSVGQGSRSRDETGGTCAKTLSAVEPGRGEGRERLELPRCRQQLRYPHPPLPLSEHNARSVRGRGLGQRCRPAGPNGSQPYLIVVHTTNRTAPQARQKDYARVSNVTGLLASYGHHGLCMDRAVRALVCRRKGACPSHNSTRTGPDGTPGGAGRWLLVSHDADGA
jgi:hypothetical protein